jgi:F0F1-type ATP synthase assembly protein I
MSVHGVGKNNVAKLAVIIDCLLVICKALLLYCKNPDVWGCRVAVSKGVCFLKNLIISFSYTFIAGRLIFFLGICRESLAGGLCL